MILKSKVFMKGALKFQIQ